jgi:hypothetical protein
MFNFYGIANFHFLQYDYVHFYLFCDVAKIIIIDKKFATFGYRQVVQLKTCSNISILWLITIFYCKKLTIYIFTLKKIQ